MPNTQKNNSFYITTPIYYVNGTPHIGHIYTSLAADILARFHKLCGKNVFFLTGTDEHGLKNQQVAEIEGIPTLDYCTRVSDQFRAALPDFNIHPDRFIRTTEDDHKKAAQALWQMMENNGFIYKDYYKGWYDVREESYVNEEDTTALENGDRIASDNGHILTWMEEESYFFKLSAFEEKLLDLYEKNPNLLKPDYRRNEVIQFIKSGLRDFSISRTSFSWGIPVPGDEKHVMYVWVDALTNYLTALGFPNTESDHFKQFWGSAEHLLGKDILRFHAVYWPAMLMAADIDMPQKIFAHGWLLSDGKKMGKSSGNALDPYHLKETYGLDPLRYCLMREVSFGRDSTLGSEALIARVNSELANDFGNLIQRSCSMIYKNCDAKIPTPGHFTPEDQTLLDQAYGLFDHVKGEIDHYRFHKALELISQLVSNGNKYIDAQAPWALRKTDIKRMETVLYVIVEIIRIAAILLQPVIPETAKNILQQIGVLTETSDDVISFDTLSSRDAIRAGTAILKPTPKFQKVEIEADSA